MTDQAEIKTDPRVLRTRRLIMDAFSRIIHRKDFKDVTVKDITTEATINRATFYYHFLDKYELLEKVLQEDMMGHVIARIKEPLQLNEDTIKTVFVAITEFQTSISENNHCQRNFQSFAATYEIILKSELERTFFEMLTKGHSGASQESMRVASALLSWGIYGATMDWQQNCKLGAEAYIELAMPYLSRGIDSLYEKESSTV